MFNNRPFPFGITVNFVPLPLFYKRLEMSREVYVPNFIFESSWEVCNKVGGIYTVLSTRAKTLQDKLKDHIMFIGPDVWKEKENPLFEEDASLLKSWRDTAENENLHVRIGRWNVPGHPIAVLVDFQPTEARWFNGSAVPAEPSCLTMCSSPPPVTSVTPYALAPSTRVE